MPTTRQGGRRSEAARNDVQVLEAAREVFVTLGPAAAMSDVAARAGVGIGTLYRRYPNKTDLIRVVCTEAMRQSLTEAHSALEEEPDGWSALARFVRRSVCMGTGALNGLAGTFDVTDDMVDLARQQQGVVDEIVDRARDEGGLREGVTAAELMVLVAHLSAGGRVGNSREMRERFTEIMLDGLRASNTSSLPGPQFRWEDLRVSWSVPSGQ